MPSTVLITSSTCCVINDSTSSGAAPGSPTRTETVGRSTAGKRSTPSGRNQPHQPRPATRQSSSRRQAGEYRFQLVFALCGCGYSTTSTGCPDCRLPGSTITFSPRNSGDDLRKLIAATPGRDRFLQCLTVLHNDHFLDSGKRDDRVIRHRHSHLRIVGNDLGMRKRTGRSLPLFRTSASTTSIRFCSAITGLSRMILPT